MFKAKKIELDEMEERHKGWSGSCIVARMEKKLLVGMDVK